MKRPLTLLLVCTLIATLALLAAGCAGGTTPPGASEPPPESQTPDGPPEASESPESPALTPSGSGNYTSEMKIPYGRDISPDDGADGYYEGGVAYFTERDGDHPDSPYFAKLDFYNMVSTDTLTILPEYKTVQQTSEWSCGPAAALTVIEYFGNPGALDEMAVSEFRPQGLEPSATSLDEMLEIFEKAGGFDVVSTRNFDGEFWLDTIQTFLAEGTPVLICWNDWGGHWQSIIGYDTMGTELESDDVLIVADPYDTTDHNQDGYGVIPAERFIYNFTMYDFFDGGDENNDTLFVAAKPAA
ncbi:MAG: hypothetical protein LBK23_09730 [Oscillospiraceae bacterium]|nr:hypothetical protein [Oscillospiraceae bacterium]